MVVLDFSKKTSEEVENWFDSLVLREKENDAAVSATFFVSYRGEWCPFCLRYTEDLSEAYGQLKEAGGKVVLFTSDSLKNVEHVAKEMELPFDFIVSDTTHKLTSLLRKRDLPSPVITGENGDEGYSNAFYTKYAKVRGHQHGLLQPSVIVVSAESKPLFHWKIEPRLANFGGATDRPDIKVIVNLIVEKARGKRDPYEVVTIEELKKHVKVKKLSAADWRTLRFLFRGVKGKKAKKGK